MASLPRVGEKRFSDKRAMCWGWGEGVGSPLTAVLEVVRSVLSATSWQNSLDQTLSLPLFVVFKYFF